MNKGPSFTLGKNFFFSDKYNIPNLSYKTQSSGIPVNINKPLHGSIPVKSHNVLLLLSYILLGYHDNMAVQTTHMTCVCLADSRYQNHQNLASWYLHTTKIYGYKSSLKCNEILIIKNLSFIKWRIKISLFKKIFKILQPPKWKSGLYLQSGDILGTNVNQTSKDCQSCWSKRMSHYDFIFVK